MKYIVNIKHNSGIDQVEFLLTSLTELKKRVLEWADSMLVIVLEFSVES